MRYYYIRLQGHNIDFYQKNLKINMSLEHIIEQKLTRERYAHVGVILGAAIGATNYVLTKDTEQSNQIAQVVGNYAIQGAGLGYCIGYIKSMYDEFKERFRN